ncbi:very short patch repair endonuclease [Hyphococcus sp.]|uniref:very short patch repair endonuclease n=1 Tax=Hyphococcus sp. TaxID=2038636 RepID=UPI0035C735D4
MTKTKSTDVFTKEKRSEVMRAVKGRDTKPEVALRKKLHALGFRYRLNVKDLPGKPDLVFPKYKTAVFVHGCFWHGHQCKRGNRQPKQNADYWKEKIARNKARDKKNAKELEKLGWRVITVWECELKDLDPASLPIKRS